MKLNWFNVLPRITGILIIIVVLLSRALAQDSIPHYWEGLLLKSPYSKPFVSEMHSTMNKAELGYNRSYAEFDLTSENSKFNRPVVELHAGFEMPLYAYGYGTKGSKNAWGFGIRLPLSVHVLEDMWGPETAPVINTDYRFGGPRIVAIKKISDHGFIQNISFSWLTLFHECTHLGDEIVIYRIDKNFPVTRINVSYEFTEFQATINDPEMCKGNCHSFRIGMMYRVSDRGLGWYSVRKGIETNQDVNLAASKRRAEYYLEYQYKRVKGFLANSHFQNFVSFEVRNRVRYGYPIYQNTDGVWETKVINENMEPCFNLYYGYKFFPKADDSHSLGLFLHGYKGLNPYGQLRNYPSYPFFGLSLTYEP